MNKKTLNIIICVIFIIIILILGLIIKSKDNNGNNTILSTQIDEKESKIQELNNELEREKENLSILQKEYNEYKTNNTKVDTSSLEKEIETKSNKIQELSNQIDELKSSNNTTALKNELSTKKKKIKELENSVNDLKSSKEELENELLSKTNEINELNSELENKNTNITTLENEILTKTNKVNELESEILTKTTKINELEKEIEVLKNSYLVVYVADSNIVNTFNVEKGKNVSSVPNVPSKTGYTGAWSADGTNITEDTIIFANYSAKTYNIYYKLDFGEFNDINIAEFEIDNTKYVYMDDYNAVFKLGENINPNGTTNFEIDNEEFSYSADHVTKTSTSQDYWGSVYGRYFVFYIEDQAYLMNINNNSLYPCTVHNVRTDFVFIVGNNHYKIGGDEFAVYNGEDSYKMDRVYYRLEWIYYYIENNKVYDENNVEVTEVVNNKFTLNIYDEDHEYTLDSHYPGVSEISSTGTFKDKTILTTTYKYGDRVVKLPSISEAINDINIPKYASPRSWVVKLLNSNNELYLIEETYGDIYIYIDWNIPS